MLKCKAGKLIEVIWPLVKHDVPVFIHGWTGIGKTEMISGPLMRKIEAEFGPSVLHDFRFSSKEPVDGTGIPVVDADKRKTTWTQPAFVPDDDGRMHVFYLGEIGHASVPMQHIAYQFVRERQLGDFKLPRQNRIILDLNTRDDKGGDIKLVKPLENRGAHVLMELDVPGWIEHAKEIGADPRLIAFIKVRPALLHKLDTQNPAYPTPRSIVELNKLFKAGESARDIENAAKALCGEGFAVELAQFMKDLGAGLPRLADIKANPDKAKLPGDLNHQWVIASSIAHEMGEHPEDAEIWARYLKRLAPDIASMAAHNAMQKNKDLERVKAVKSLKMDE